MDKVKKIQFIDFNGKPMQPWNVDKETQSLDKPHVVGEMGYKESYSLKGIMLGVNYPDFMYLRQFVCEPSFRGIITDQDGKEIDCLMSWFYIEGSNHDSNDHFFQVEFRLK